MKTTIVVKLQYEALHHWPSVVEVLPHKPEIAFLKWPHRHNFFITVEKEVTHADRDIEIICFKHDIQQFLQETYKGNLGAMSCEMLADRILKTFECEMVEVLEDNENGGRVYK